MRETTVVLGVDDPALEEQVLHYLDRRPRLKVLDAVGEGPRLARRVRDAAPDAAVVSPGVLGSAPDLDGAAVLVVAERETTEGLRTAIGAGARGFYLWPEEREALAKDAIRTARPREAEARAGQAVAVYGPRGGAGATFLATHLAAATAGQGAATILADLDASYGDVAAAIGAPVGTDAPTIATLDPVLDEVGGEHLDRVLYEHPGGFRALLGPSAPAEPMRADHVARLVRALRSRADVAVVHLARSLDAATRAAFEAVDRVMLVVTLDVLAFRDTRRALDLLTSLGREDAGVLVVNKAARDEVVPRDVERVFGIPPAAVIRRDRAVPRAQNRGELLRRGSGPAVRAVGALARRLLADEEESS